MSLEKVTLVFLVFFYYSLLNIKENNENKYDVNN